MSGARRASWLTLMGMVGMVFLGGCAADPSSGLAGDLGLAAPPSSTPAGARDLAPGPIEAPPVRGPFPIVLAHGFSGFRNIGPIDYFYGVAQKLRADGHVVYVSQVVPYQTSEFRGKQLADYISQVVLPQTGAKRVNIIGHSQGGLDARYAVTLLGDKVASVTTVATPHHGTEVADIATGDRLGPLSLALAALLDLLGAGQGNSDASASIKSLTTAAATRFNAKVVDHPRVSYFSVGGRSANNLAEGVCNPPTQAAFLARWDSYRDPLGSLLWTSGRILEQDVTPRRPHDGLVSVESSRWGIFLGCVPADHLGEVCQLLGAPRQGDNPFECGAFYRDLARWLVERGF